MTPIGFMGSRSALGLGLGTSAPGGGPVITWYRAGGAPLPVAVYQPKGAESYTASKINLANPGTYNAADGASYPTWNVLTGWTFAPNKYLNTGVTPTSTSWSMIARFANITASNSFALGCQNNSVDEFALIPNRTTFTKINFSNCRRTAGASDKITGGIMAVGGQIGYLNGSVDATLVVGVCPTVPVYLGCLNVNGTPMLYFVGDILAFAIWNTSTGAETWLPAVSTALAAI